ncbi:MAG: metal ABC transporter permease [Candidatus Sungbacteria bacterium]|nr:metal ABC transporter permease [Candidatus Sungbacteria bacterium]
MTNIDIFSFLLAAITAVASGMVGSFALMRRMTLAGDALSHVALPGMGLAILYSYNPVWGGALALLVGVLIIWKVEKLTHLNIEAVIGVLFSVSLALGALIIEEEHELVETLFGGVSPISRNEFLLGCVIAAVVIGFIIRNRHALVLSLVSKELAKTSGISVDRLQLSFLIVFALTVILGLKFLGVLLMGSLIIIPAATARNLAKNLNGMLAIASGSAVVSVIGGLMIAERFDFTLGPIIIAIAGMLFVISLLLYGKTSGAK